MSGSIPSEPKYCELNRLSTLLHTSLSETGAKNILHFTKSLFGIV